MKETYEKKYHETEKSHFWFKARRAYILQLLAAYPKNIQILDIGCSSGILLNELAAAGFEPGNLFGIDISPRAIQNCRDNGIQNAYVMDAQHIELEQKFDVIIASDCLEHLEDDDKALNNWHSLLKPNGSLLVFVPAFMALWSEHDEVNMHYRRYTQRQLETKLQQNNFQISKSSYWNFLLFLPVLTVRLLSKLPVIRKQKTTGDLEEPSLFNNLFYNLISLENKTLKYINFPVGVSTFCIAKKKGADNDQTL